MAETMPMSVRLSATARSRLTAERDRREATGRSRSVGAVLVELALERLDQIEGQTPATV